MGAKLETYVQPSFNCVSTESVVRLMAAECRRMA